MAADPDSATRPSRAALAARTSTRCGVAAKVARIRPLPYSLVTTSAPSAPKNTAPICTKPKLTSSGSKAARFAALNADQFAA